MRPRPYQEQAREAVHRELATHRSTLIVAATGTGKTIMLAAVAKDYVDQGKRVLVITALANNRWRKPAGWEAMAREGAAA